MAEEERSEDGLMATAIADIQTQSCCECVSVSTSASSSPVLDIREKVMTTTPVNLSMQEVGRTPPD